MTHQHTLVPRLQQPNFILQKLQITLKLLLLENAQYALEQDLLHFTDQVYKDVFDIFNSFFPAAVFTDLLKTLDETSQAIEKLSSLLRTRTAGAELSIWTAIATNHSKPLKVNYRNPIMGVVRFGPVLQNLFMMCSLPKAVQVFGAPVTHQQQKRPLSSQHVVQPSDPSGSKSTNFNNNTLTTGSSCHLKAEEQLVFKDKGQADATSIQPSVVQSSKLNEETSNILLPPLQAVFPEVSNHKPMLIWGRDEDIQVQHQKQTSLHLQHFLRPKAKNKSVLIVRGLEWSESKYKASNPDWPQRVSPTVKTPNHKFRHVVTDDSVGELSPRTLHANVGSQAPVFRVKTVKSSGSLIYSCVIATETELWDIGDVFTEVLLEDSVLASLESENCQNTIAQVENLCINMGWKTKALQCSEPKPQNKFALSERSTATSVNIPEFQIRKFDEAEVVVSHIVSPGNFYIQYADSVEKLQALLRDCKVTCSHAEQNCIPDIGTKVLCWFPWEEQWCRAEVMKICGVSRDNSAADGAGSESSIKVEVRRLDYGNTTCLSLRNVEELTPEMALLPLQALQVSLANVSPVNGGGWSEEAVSWFKAMVHNRRLYARLNPQGPTVTVELFLEKGKLGAMRRGASLSLRLAQNGHAKHNQLKKAGLVKTRAVQDSDWKKYLLMCDSRYKK
ncbi:putative LOC107395772-like protein [Nothobranchius furzeri]|uniref:LOC107395772-like protein n=1 Tax=Nothobranchius furzeri TaxID=105023 RepID=A0A9D2Z0S0_NOTFU|nr:putative LOC107395772-like protein [Nothobranchius furzeri]